MAAVLKTAFAKANVGSNPTPSAKLLLSILITVIFINR